MSYYGKDVPFHTLNGKILTSITEDDNNEDGGLIFKDDEGNVYWMGHRQNCCESVYLESQDGDFDDLLNTPIMLAEERSNDDPPKDKSDEDYGVYEWTFYEIRTIKGSVTLRWYGTSNGYYSTSVDFEDITPKK